MSLIQIREEEDKFVASPVASGASLGEIVKIYTETKEKALSIAALHALRRLFLLLFDRGDLKRLDLSEPPSPLAKYREWASEQFLSFVSSSYTFILTDGDFGIPILISLLEVFSFPYSGVCLASVITISTP